MSKKLKYLFAVLGLLFITIGGYIECSYYKSTEKYFVVVKENYSKTIKNEKQQDSLSLSIINEVEEQVEGIARHSTEKKQMQKEIKDLKEYYLLKKEIEDLYVDEKINIDKLLLNVENIEKKYNKLLKTNKEKLKEKFEAIKTYKDNLNNIETEISNLFSSNKKDKINDTVTLNDIKKCREKLSNIEKSEFVNNKNKELDKATNLIEKREEEKRKEEIEKAWVTLKVPYINQNDNKIYNGCEAASLLMGLQYKGYLKNVTLKQIASDMPKSKTNNAYEGFTHDIFNYAPVDVPHWIAPNALAKFGRDYSGNNKVVDVSGYTLDELNQEISKNNPVVIYVTANFETPTTWIEGAPQNLHVVLLTGYNKITKEQIITDPAINSNIKTWTLSKKQVESIYNSVGKKAVVIG